MKNKPTEKSPNFWVVTSPIILLGILVIAFFLTAAGCAKEKLTNKMIRKSSVLINDSNVEIYTITLDGKTYYAISTGAGSYSLCPKQ